MKTIGVESVENQPSHVTEPWVFEKLNQPRCVWCVQCVWSAFLNTNDQALSAKARKWLSLRGEDCFIQTCTSLLLCCKSSPGPLPIVGWVTGRLSFVRILPLLCLE